MRIQAVSDVHYELGSHHGVDESRAFDWLMKKLRWARPRFLVGLGDWGHAWTKPQWDELTSLCRVLAIYGNHDKLELLSGLRNTDGSTVLVSDGETRDIAGLHFGFINGIVSESGHVKEGVPRKSVEEYERAGSSLSGIDVLCTHESPYLPDYHSWIRESPGTKAVEAVIRKVKPKLALSGHLTAGPYTIGKVGETISLRVESSAAGKHFALLDSETGILQVYHDWEPVKSVSGIF